MNFFSSPFKAAKYCDMQFRERINDFCVEYKDSSITRITLTYPMKILGLEIVSYSMIKNWWIQKTIFLNYVPSLKFCSTYFRYTFYKKQDGQKQSNKRLFQYSLMKWDKRNGFVVFPLLALNFSHFDSYQPLWKKSNER